MTNNLSHPIYVISWVYAIFIVLSEPCRAQSTNSSSSNGVSGPFHFDKSTATMVVVFGSALFFVIALSRYVYRFPCYGSDNFSTPVQTSAANVVPTTLEGLNHETIETFPILLYSAVKKIKIGSESMECAICLSEFEDDDTLRFIPICHHVFHPECIDAWLSTRITCPVCRANLAEKFEQEWHETNVDNSNSESIETDAPDQIVIVTANEDQNEVVSPKPNKVYRKFSRSHSTGHSLVVLPVETTGRYTLRLPEEVRRQILMANAKLKRVRSMNVVLDPEGSSRKGRRLFAGNEGSGVWTRIKSLHIQRRNKWAFCATPPFVTRGEGSVRIARFGNDREGSVNGGSVGNGRFGGNREGSSVEGKTTLLASIKTDGVESSPSPRPSV